VHILTSEIFLANLELELNLDLGSFDFQGQLIFVPPLQCLLVKGWKAGASWSFPRGKRNKDEKDHTCAVREVKFCLYHAVLCSLSVMFVFAGRVQENR
jgi:hypothetical protein